MIVAFTVLSGPVAVVAGVTKQQATAPRKPKLDLEGTFSCVNVVAADLVMIAYY